MCVCVCVRACVCVQNVKNTKSKLKVKLFLKNSVLHAQSFVSKVSIGALELNYLANNL